MNPPQKKGGGQKKRYVGGTPSPTLLRSRLAAPDSPRKGEGEGEQKKRGGGHTLALGGEEPLKPVEVVVANSLVSSIEVQSAA